MQLTNEINNKNKSKDFIISIGILSLLSLPIVAALGSYLVPVNIGGITLYGYRFLVIFLTISIFILKMRFRKSLLLELTILLFIIWVVWAGISIYWAPDTISGVKDLFALLLGTSSALVIILFSDMPNRIQYLRKGWVYAFILTAFVALWEILTGTHLPSNYQNTQPAYVLNRLYVASTFGNPNNYAAFLTLCFPFLVWEAMIAKTKKSKFVIYILLAVFPVLLLLTASRICFLGWILELFLVVMLLAKGTHRLYFSLFIFLVVSYAFSSGLVDDLHIISKIANASSSEGSISTRINVYLNGLWLVQETYGMGVGAGGFEHLLLRSPMPFPTNTISNPHNFSLEILSEYGLLVFILFLTLMLFILYKSIVNMFSQRIEDKQIGIIIFTAMAGYFFASLANSTYLNIPINWVFIGSVIAILIRTDAKKLNI